MDIDGSGGETIGSSGDAITIWRSNMNEVCFSIATESGEIAECHLVPKQAHQLLGALTMMLLEIKIDPSGDDESNGDA